jgi:ELWxxDGT repeat protein
MVYRPNIATESSLLETTLSSLDLSYNDTPFFGANGALWKLTRRQDGSPDAIAIKTFTDPAPENRSPGRIYGLSDFTTMRTSTGTINLFVNGGRELWSTDGTEAGTIKLQNFNIAFYAMGFAEVPSLHVLGKRDGFLYLEGDADPMLGVQQALWKTDGTVAGTVKVQDLFEWQPNAFSPEGSYPSFVSATYFLQDRVILTRDSVNLRERSSIDLATGEKQAIDFSSKVGRSYEFQYDNNHLYLWNSDTSGETNLWTTDGTIEGTTRLGNFQKIGLKYYGTDYLYFLATAADGRSGLWSTNGSSTEFLFSLEDSEPSSRTFSPRANILFQNIGNGRSLITVRTGGEDSSARRFLSNGTPAGTVQLAADDFAAGHPEEVILDGFSYYLERGSLRKENLVTRFVEVISSTDVYLSGVLRLVDGRLVMAGETATYGWELWQSDGTLSGTRMIRDLNATPVPIILTTVNTYPQAADWDIFAGRMGRNRVTGEVAKIDSNGSLSQIFRSISTVADFNWQIVGLSDFNRDRQEDILWQNRQTGEVAIWKLDDNNQVTVINLPTVGLDWSVKGLADFDRDGNIDLFWQNELTGETAFWLLKGGQFKSGKFSAAVAVGWDLQGLADLDNDGDVDMVWRNSTSGKVMTRQLDRLNVVADTVLSPAPDSSWQIRGIADVDSDGRYDIFWHRPGTSETGFWTLDQFQFKAGGFFDRDRLSFLINKPDPVELHQGSSFAGRDFSNLVIRR